MKNKYCDYEDNTIKNFPKLSQSDFSNVGELCKHEYNTLRYFVGQLPQSELASTEEHIANCSQCCKTIAELTKSMSAQETPQEKAFLKTYFIQSQLEIRKLIKESLEAKTNPNSNIVSLSAKKTKKNVFSYLKNTYLVFAAALAFVVLFGGMMFFITHKSSSPISSSSNPKIAQSIADLREINAQGRPTKFRLEGFGYAPPAKDRGQYLAEVKSKLNKTENALNTEINDKVTAENLNLIAQTRIMSGKYNEAIEALDKALLLSPNDPALLTNLAVSYAAKSDYQNALTAINKALAINENYLIGIFNRALIYQELKQYNGARSDWKKYLELDSSSRWSVEAKENLSNIK